MTAEFIIGGPPGDAYLTVRVEPHPRFSLEGRDLFTEVTLEPWAQGAYSTQINGVGLPGSTLCYVEHPDGMIAQARAPLDFYAIQLSLAGSVGFELNRRPAVADTQHGVMLSAGEVGRFEQQGAAVRLPVVAIHPPLGGEQGRLQIVAVRHPAAP